jgi:hypothetical protein
LHETGQFVFDPVFIIAMFVTKKTGAQEGIASIIAQIIGAILANDVLAFENMSDTDAITIGALWFFRFAAKAILDSGSGARQIRGTILLLVLPRCFLQICESTI